MAITLAQFEQAMQLADGIEVKRANADRYEAAMNDYINGGPLSGELQEVLRSWLAGELPALLSAYRAGIQADVNTLRTLVTGYV